MDNNHMRRFVTLSAAADDDIISNLSEDLINPILERLLVKDAVRTSVLSKKWRYRWTTMRKLYFTQQFLQQLSKVGAYQHNGFIRVISQILIHHQGPIFTFHLRIPQEINLDSFQEVDQWMLILSRNSVEELLITNLNRIYPVPSSLFSCLKFRVLMLYNCIYKPPLEFQGFPNLHTLRLRSVHFGSNLGGTVINLPRLKFLTLEDCANVNNFNIKAVNLHTLWVIMCPDAPLLRLLHSERLVEVCIYFRKYVKDFLQVERFNLAMMLRCLRNMDSFAIDGYFLKFLAAEKFPKWLPHKVNCLETLELQGFSFGDLDQLQGALCLLQNSPNLNVLCVTRMKMGPDDDLELTSNYLEFPKCLDHETLFMLQTVELTHLEGSRPELLFIKLLLDRSPHLENVNIQLKRNIDAEKRFNIAKDILMFPRASTKAKVVFMDP